MDVKDELRVLDDVDPEPQGKTGWIGVGKDRAEEKCGGREKGREDRGEREGRGG